MRFQHLQNRPSNSFFRLNHQRKAIRRTVYPVAIEAIGGLAAVLTTLCWLPQAVRIIRTRDAAAISLPTNVVFAAGIALWLTYGIALGKWPIIAANAVTLPLILTIIALKIRHG
jgi:MtN3 and saliva related transmembrane protein